MAIKAVPIHVERLHSDTGQVLLAYGARGRHARWMDAMVQLVSSSGGLNDHDEEVSKEAGDVLEALLDLGSDPLLGLYITTWSGLEVNEQFLLGHFEFNEGDGLALIGVFMGGERDTAFLQQFGLDAAALATIGENQIGFLVVTIPRNGHPSRGAAVITTGEDLWEWDAYRVPEGLRRKIINTGLMAMSASEAP